MSSMVVKYGPCLLTLKKKIQVFKTKCIRKLLHISYLEHKTSNWVQSKITSVWVHRNLFWQLSRDRNLHGSGKSHAMTASLKPSFREPWRVGNTVVHTGNAGWTTSKSGHLCPCQNWSEGPPAEKTERGSLLNHSSCPPNNPIGQGTELNYRSQCLRKNIKEAAEESCHIGDAWWCFECLILLILTQETTKYNRIWTGHFRQNPEFIGIYFDLFYI